jgi:cytochrome bd-type quinol oxidase subunit 2
MIDFWTAVLGLTIFLYVTLDGFDLGVGMLMPLVEARRSDAACWPRSRPCGTATKPGSS